MRAVRSTLAGALDGTPYSNAATAAIWGRGDWWYARYCYRCAWRTMGSGVGRAGQSPGRGAPTPASSGRNGEYPVSAVTLDKRVQDFVDTRRQLFIDGQLVDAKSGKTFETVNPATGETLATVAEGDAADIDLAVRAARRAFEDGPWSRMTPSERGRIMWRIGDLLTEHLEEFAELETLDNGKPLAVARAADVPLAAELFRYMAGWATKIEGNTIALSVPYAPGRPVPRLHPAGADRRGRTDHPVELPAADGGLEDRPGPGNRKHGRAQAGRADPAFSPLPGGDHGRGRTAGRCRQRRHWFRRDRGRRLGGPRSSRQDRLHWLHRGRPAHRQGRDRKPEEGQPGTGRKESQYRLLRRRSSGRHRRCRQCHLLQPRAMLCGRVPAVRGSRPF